MRVPSGWKQQGWKQQRWKQRALGCAAVFALAGPPTLAHAQSPDPAKAEPPAQGVKAGATYDGETVSDLAGGAKRSSTYHGSLQVQAAFDFERLLGWSDTTGFAYGMWLHGGQPDDLAGGAQGVSSITGPRGARLDEAWLQRYFLGARLSLLGGRYDLNSEFYRLHSAALFLNSSFGMGPELSQSGPAGPSAFPSTALGARAQYKATPEVVLRAALLNGAPYNRVAQNATTRGGNGALIVSEAAYFERPGNAEPRNRRLRTGRFSELMPYDDKYAIGLWRYTATFEDLSAAGPGGEPVQRRGSSGGYLLVDRLLTRSSAPSGARIAAFLQPRSRRCAREPLRLLCRRGAGRLRPVSGPVERGGDRRSVGAKRLALRSTAGAARHAGATIGNRRRADLSCADLEVDRGAARPAVHPPSGHRPGAEERARVPAALRDLVLAGAVAFRMPRARRHQGYTMSLRRFSLHDCSS